jgi:hypothetical protein
MKAKEFNKLLKKYENNPQELIRQHCNLKIYLSSYQFDKVVRIRDGKRLNYENSIKNSDNNSNNGLFHRLFSFIK